MVNPNSAVIDYKEILKDPVIRKQLAEGIDKNNAIQQKIAGPDYYKKLLDYEGFEENPYPDSKGIMTVGLGHRIMPGEDFTGYKKEDFEKLFNEKDLPEHINRTKKLVKNFESFPNSLKEEVVSSVFRGGLSGSPKTLGLINEGKYKEASVEFLNNKEYREAKAWEKKNNKKHGVARRMENLSNELKKYGESQTKKDKLSLADFFISEAHAAEIPGAKRSIGATGSWDEGLTMQEKILSSEVGNKLIDVLSGGMSLEKIEGLKKEQIEGYKNLLPNIPKIASAIVKTNVPNALHKFITQEPMYTEDEKYAFLQQLNTVLKPLGRVVQPLKEAVHGALDLKPGDIPKRMIKGFLSPEDTESITSRVPMAEFEREGSVARLIPRAIAEAVEQVAFTRLAFGKPIQKIAQQAKYAKYDRVRGSIEKMVPELEKSGKVKFPAGFTTQQKVDTIIQAAGEKKEVGDFLNQVIKKTPLARNILKGEAAQLNIGDMAKFGDKVGKIVKIDGPKAILSIAGKEVSAALSDLKVDVDTQARQAVAEGKVIYHGTAEVFKDFDIDKSADGTIWFTDNKSKIEKGEVSASGKGQIMERIIDENKLKLGGWEENDKYGVGELIKQGYDGLKLVDEDETTYQIFYPEKLSMPKSQLTAAYEKAKGETQDIDWDAPTEQTEIQASTEYNGFTDKQLVGELSDLVSNFEPGQTILDFEGNYSRLSSGFLKEFSNKGYTQKYLQNIYSKYAEGKALTPGQEQDLIATLNTFKGYFGIQPSDRIPDIVTPAQLKVSKANMKLVQQFGKMLSKPVPAAKVKGIVRQTTEQVKDKGAMIPESKALQRSLQRQATVARKAEIEGRKAGEQKVKEIVAAKEVRGKERRALSAEVKKMVRFIKNVPTTNLPLEYKDVLEEIKAGSDFNKVRVGNVLRRTKERRKLDIDEQLESKISDIEKINADNMSVDELREVYDVVQQIYHSGIWEDKLMKAASEKKLSEMVVDGAKTILRGKPTDLPPAQKHLSKKLAEMPEHLRRAYIAEHRRPEAVFEQFDGFKEGTNYNTVFKPVVKSFQDYMRGLGTSTKDLEKIFNPVNISKILHSKLDVDGLATGISRDNLMFIYANSFHPQNISHLEASGINDKIRALVENSLTPAEKKVVRDAMDYMVNDIWTKLDKTYSKLKGVHLGKVSENFFPIMNLENVGDIENIEMNINLLEDFRRTGNPGFLKERANISDKAYKRYSFFENVYRYMRQAEYYSSMAESVRDAGKYLQHPVISNAIKTSYGEEYTKVLMNWMDDIKRGRMRADEDFLDTLSTALRGNYVVSVLGGNLSTVTKQPVSFMQGSGYIGGKWAVKGLFNFLVHPVKMIKFVESKSTQMANRAFSQERELQEIMAGRGMAKKFGQKDLRDLQQMIREGSMWPILAADKVTVTSLWKGAYDKSMSQNPDEQVAIDYADKAIRRTQPQSSIVDLPELFRKGAFKKMITLFRNQPNQNWNLLYDTYVKAGTEPKTAKGFAEFMNKNFYYLLFGGLTYGYVNRKRIQKSFGEVAMDLANQFTGGMFGLGDVVSKIQYPWGSANMLDGLFADAAKIVTSKKPETKAKYVGRLTGKVTGIPAYTSIERVITRESLKTKLFGGEREKIEKPTRTKKRGPVKKRGAVNKRNPIKKRGPINKR